MEHCPISRLLFFTPFYIPRGSGLQGPAHMPEALKLRLGQGLWVEAHMLSISNLTLRAPGQGASLSGPQFSPLPNVIKDQMSKHVIISYASTNH